MAIIEQLGLNSSFFFQFVIALISFVILGQLVFKPYLSALEMREQRTTGSESDAVELLKQTEQLKRQYETEARVVAGRVKEIFDDFRSQASQEAEQIVQTARAQSTQLLESGKAGVAEQLSRAYKDIELEVPKISGAMKERLLLNS